MNMQPTEIGKQQFNVSHLHEAPLAMDNGEVVFEIELRLRHLDQCLFIGLLEAEAREPHRGIGVSIDPNSGEIADVVNDQGIIGYLEDLPLEVNSATFLCLEFEKIKRIFIPKLTLGEEKILHPALHLPEVRAIDLIVGTSAMDGGAVYENPHLMVTRRTPGVSAS